MKRGAACLATLLAGACVLARVADAGGARADAGRARTDAGRGGKDGSGDRDDRARDPFVRVVGNQFTLRNHPFYFVGANLAIMHGPDNRAAAEDVLAGAATDGIKVARIWALGEGAADAAPWIRENFLFRVGENGWIEAAVTHLDRVIAAAGRVGVRVIITLANNWADYGGIPRYLKWAGRWTAGVYGVEDRFYADARARAAFRAHVERLLGRTNHLTGVRYRDDPTILAWELLNESSVATNAGTVARRAWIVEMARLVHARDPNHLVTPGVGGYRFERERRDWLAICRLPEVDFCDGHVYPEELLRDRDADRLDAVLDDYVRLAQTLAHKPFVLGEFGVRGDDGGGRWREHDRAWWTAHVLERLRYDGAAGGLIWIYQGARGTDRAHGITIGAAGIDPASDAIRAAMKNAALAAEKTGAGGAPATNPLIAGENGEASLMPLHAEFPGRSRVVPLLRGDEPRPERTVVVTWNPVGYARADWESSGIYGGGAVEHAWGAETGWFEYEYIVMPPPALAAARAAPASVVVSASVRARVSSEYPGTLSPPDGATVFDVSLDGASLGTATAPRDDGRGQWITVRAGRGAASLKDPLSPGPHRLRFTVPPGPHAHGLSMYGRDGDKPVAGIETGPIELRLGLRNLP